jgi:hypothetical protein
LGFATGFQGTFGSQPFCSYNHLSAVIRIAYRRLLMTSSAAIVKEHIRESKKFMKTIRSKRDAKNFLIRAGILTKSGNKLAKPYR